MLKSFFHKEKSSSQKEKHDISKYFEEIIEASPQSIFITDLEGHITYVNKRFSEITGYSPDEIIGQTPRIFRTEYTPPEFYDLLRDRLKNGERWVGEFANRCKDDSIIYVHAEILPLLDKDGQVSNYLAFEEDITHRKELDYELGKANQQIKEYSEERTSLKKQIQDQGLLDRLTGLHDRTYLAEILPREILRSVRAKTNLFVLLIDIEQFKLINQKYNYSIGDTILKNFAASLNELLGDFDFVCRYNGTSFVVLVSGKTDEVGLTYAKKIKDYFDSNPIDFETQQLFLFISIGMSVYPENGKTMDELLNKAESALTHAKQNGGKQISLWAETL